MSATNSTTYYELPIFLGSDKPAWLVDWNGAMNAIDTAIAQAKSAADAAQGTASTATTDIATINSSLTTISGQISSLTTAVNTNTGSINTITSLIGNGEPTTTDKTIIGAINEIYADITGGGTNVTAANVSYDNTTSGLTADDVQEAVDEIFGKIEEGHIYSTDEKVVGKWIDGKDIYEKTINIGHSYPIDYNLSSLGIETQISCSGTNSDLGVLPFIVPTDTYSCHLNFTKTNYIQARIGSSVTAPTADTYVTIRYTKV